MGLGLELGLGLGGRASVRVRVRARVRLRVSSVTNDRVHTMHFNTVRADLKLVPSNLMLHS